MLGLAPDVTKSGPVLPLQLYLLLIEREQEASINPSAMKKGTVIILEAATERERERERERESDDIGRRELLGIISSLLFFLLCSSSRSLWSLPDHYCVRPFIVFTRHCLSIVFLGGSKAEEAEGSIGTPYNVQVTIGDHPYPISKRRSHPFFSVFVDFLSFISLASSSPVLIWMPTLIGRLIIRRNCLPSRNNLERGRHLSSPSLDRFLRSLMIVFDDIFSAYGSVYKAKIKTGFTVAAKRVVDDPSAQGTIKREVDILKRVNNPYIVCYFGCVIEKQKVKGKKEERLEKRFSYPEEELGNAPLWVRRRNDIMPASGEETLCVTHDWFLRYRQ